MNVVYKNILIGIFYLFPFVLGIYGFTMAFGEFSLAVVYSTLRLYSFNMDTPSLTETSLILWIAFFLAVSVTATILIKSIKVIYKFLGVRFAVLFNNKTINVLGDPTYIEEFIKVNKNNKDHYKIITSEDSAAFRANDIVILGKSRVETLSIFNKFEAEIEKAAERKRKNVFATVRNRVPEKVKKTLRIKNSTPKFIRVHLNAECLNSNLTNNSVEIHTFDFIDNIARLFWRNNVLLESKKIVFVGFGKLGQAILTHALQNNVVLFPEDLGRIYHKYHIVGEYEQYLKLHPLLNLFLSINLEDDSRDTLHVHKDPWEDLSIFLNADWIIFCDDDSNINDSNLQKLIDHIPHSGKIFAYLDETTRSLYKPLVALAEEESKGNQTILIAFPKFEELFDVDVILNNKLQEDARQIHSNYLTAKGDWTKKDEWENLNDFTRRSNEASAEHNLVKDKIVNQSIPSSEMSIECFARLEHERWCRFHWLNNWSFAEFEDPNKNKDPHSRTHKHLKPFDEIDPELKDNLLKQASEFLESKMKKDEKEK